ncbi:hypothetical protein [Nocardioides sp. MH1]
MHGIAVGVDTSDVVQLTLPLLRTHTVRIVAATGQPVSSANVSPLNW